MAQPVNVTALKEVISGHGKCNLFPLLSTHPVKCNQVPTREVPDSVTPDV